MKFNKLHSFLFVALLPIALSLIIPAWTMPTGNENDSVSSAIAKKFDALNKEGLVVVLPFDSKDGLNELVNLNNNYIMEVKSLMKDRAEFVVNWSSLEYEHFSGGVAWSPHSELNEEKISVCGHSKRYSKRNTNFVGGVVLHGRSDEHKRFDESDLNIMELILHSNPSGKGSERESIVFARLATNFRRIMEEKYNETECKKCKVELSKDKEETIKFYKKIGFKPSEDQKGSFVVLEYKYWDRRRKRDSVKTQHEHRGVKRKRDE